MTAQTIESKDFTLKQLFQDFYVVPSFQREYVWTSDEVEQLLQDIYTEFPSDSDEKESEYFIGSIVVYPGKDGVYDLIDGQQRMTTAYLTLCAIRDHLKASNDTDPTKELDSLLAATAADRHGNDVPRYRVELQYADSGDVLQRLADQKSLENIPEVTRSITNLLEAYRTIRLFLNQAFGADTAATRDFYAYFTQNVKLIRVKTLDFSHALKVFETINDRGARLDSMDLLKNLMFIHTPQHQFETLSDLWKKLVDLLYKAKEKPLRFLRYVIFARYDVDRLPEDEIYDWIKKNELQMGYKEQPIQFVTGLLADARLYVQFIEGKDIQNQPNRYLANLRLLSSATRQHLMLLLAAQHLPTASFNELCKHMENLFFAYIIAREPTKEFERTFARWTTVLRATKTEADFDQFVQTFIQPAKVNLRERYLLAFKQLVEASVKKSQVRYILGKLAQYINENAFGVGTWSDLKVLAVGNNFHVEHILPQTPTPAVRATFDKPDQIDNYIHRLGNLTLVERAINCAVGNGLFSAKRLEYVHSNLLLTESLGGAVSIGKNTAPNRAMKDLDTFETWNSETIERRQQMLSQLALKVWDMPPTTA